MSIYCKIDQLSESALTKVITLHIILSVRSNTSSKVTVDENDVIDSKSI